jgi:hypothetical protein
LRAKSASVGGFGITVGVDVTVLVGAETLVNVGVAVGKRVGVLVGKVVFVGAGIAVRLDVVPQAARAKPSDDVPHNRKKSRRGMFFIFLFSFCA